MNERTAKQFKFSRALSGWWWLIDRDLLRVLPILVGWLVVGVSLYIVDGALGLTPTISWLSTTTIVEPFFMGVLYAVALRDDHVSLGVATGTALNRFVSLFILYILSLLGTVAGLLLLVLPGLALVVLWTVAFPILIAEQTSPIEALSRSFRAVKSSFWPVCGVVVIYLIGIIAFGIAMAFFTPMEFTSPSLTFLILESGSTVVLGFLGVCLNTAIYRELGFSGRHDLSVFD